MESERDCPLLDFLSVTKFDEEKTEKEKKDKKREKKKREDVLE